MTPDCAYVLDNNVPCRGAALRGGRFCRHHTPESLARRHDIVPARPDSGAPPTQLPDSNPWVLRAYWRKLHHWIASEGDCESLDNTLAMVLEALSDQQITARSAGRLIAAILSRKAALRHEAQDQQLRALLDQAAALRAHAPLKPSAKCPVSVEAAESVL